MNTCQYRGILLNSFCDRLRIERERLHLTQAALGEIGGVKKLAQINYEKGLRMPDAGYLEAVAKAGVDVLYVLTGQRSAPVQPSVDDVPLTRREQALLANYRGSNEEGKRILESAASEASRNRSGERKVSNGE
jgi:transcriptional regulator with XRE-family HTH domain